MILSLAIPSCAKGPSPRYDVDEVQLRNKQFHERFGTFIEQAVRLNNIPDYLLTSIVLIEDYDLVPDVVNHSNSQTYKQATGLGQHMPYSATDVISRTKSKRLMTDEKRAVLRKQLGSRLDYIEKNAGTQKLIVTQADLKDPEFNLMLTGMYLSQLLAEEGKTGTLRLDNVGLRYNQGYYYKVPPVATTAELLARLPGRSFEGYKYVLKLVGTGGLLEILA